MFIHFFKSGLGSKDTIFTHRQEQQLVEYIQENEKLSNIAQQNHLVMLCLPPHTAHRLQPLDVRINIPVSTHHSNFF